MTTVLIFRRSNSDRQSFLAATGRLKTVRTASTHRFRIGVIVEGRYMAQEQPTGMIAALRARGHQVVVFDLQSVFYEMDNDAWFNDLDVIVARGRSCVVLFLLSWAEAKNMLTINCRSAVAAVHNKAEMSVRLAAGKVPTPPTFFSGVEPLAARTASDVYPVILKPVFGDNCQGLHVARKP